jgi:hypothetical protein
MKEALRTITGIASWFLETFIKKPVRERGVSWTVLAWGWALTTLTLLDQLFRSGAALLFVIWLSATFLFLKSHTTQKKRARPLPNRRRR